MSTVLKWLLQTVLLEWLWGKLQGLIGEYLKQKKIEKEREEDNKQAQEKLEKAENEQDVVDTGSDLLKR